jgi:hypothetical protein
MRLALEPFLKKLGIDQPLRPYETIPIDYFNPDKGTDFMAGISLSGDKLQLNAEIQLITYPEQGQGNHKPDIKHVFSLKAVRDSQGLYFANYLRVMDKNVHESYKNWFETGAQFFTQCTTHIKKAMLPDLDTIFKNTFGNNDDKGDNMGGGTSSRNFKNDKLVPKQPGKI